MKYSPENVEEYNLQVYGPKREENTRRYRKLVAKTEVTTLSVRLCVYVLHESALNFLFFIFTSTYINSFSAFIIVL